MMRLDKEKERLVVENMGLVYFNLKKLEMLQNYLDYEDMVSTGMIGLIKAAITFDEFKKFAFSSYASKCIKDEILMLYRKEKKHENDISFNEPIVNQSVEQELTYESIIEDTKLNFIEDIENKQSFIKAFNYVLNYLSEKRRLVILYRLAEMRQGEIAKRLRVKEEYISRLYKRAIVILKNAVREEMDYRKVFSVTSEDDEYIITFSIKGTQKFEKKIVTCIRNAILKSKFPKSKIQIINEKVEIRIKPEPKAFYFLAELICEMEKHKFLQYLSHTNI